MINLDTQTEFDPLDFPTLRSVCLGCTRCALSQTRTQVVFGTGPMPCDLMIIGEGPGEQEDLQGHPFVGKAGQLLTKILESAQFNREKEIYITNIVKCRPPNNRTPMPAEVAACSDYLIRQIQLVKPKILLLLGSPALKAILGAHMTISQSRGQWFQLPVPYMADNLYVMPLFHPSYLLRNASREKGSPKWLTWQDIREVRVAYDFYQQATPT